MGTHSAWDLLRGAGVIDSKDTLKDALRHGQRPTAELVDAYNIQSTQVRNLLVRYLEERRPGIDYGTFRGLVRELAGVFWADIEAHHPGIDTLRLPDDVVALVFVRIADVLGQPFELDFEHRGGRMRSATPPTAPMPGTLRAYGSWPTARCRAAPRR
ncbi:hypothetical protein ABZY45_19750 [Streptomyces sp. NPDC006516]|uniref:hypothetical protein n=1 Tax=Streptomyces sp. NPDC006516 TaxID=3154309 RepID=UPI0033BF8CF3